MHKWLFTGFIHFKRKQKAGGVAKIMICEILFRDSAKRKEQNGDDISLLWARVWRKDAEKTGILNISGFTCSSFS